MTYRIIEYTLKTSLRLPVAREAAFEFFEDPKSTLRLPHVVESSGERGLGARGLVRSFNGGREIIEQWSVTDYRPAERRSVERRLVGRSPRSTVRMIIVQTDRFRRVRRGCVMTRSSVVRQPDLRISAAASRRLRKRDQRDHDALLQTLADHLAAS